MNLYAAKQLTDSMRTVRKNTIQIAEEIPEKDYDYRPIPEGRSVLETLVHIASLAHFDRIVHEEQHLSSLEGFDFGALFKKGEAGEKRLRAKSDVVALLLTQGDRCCEWVEGLPESLLSEHVRQPGGALKTRFEMLVGTKEHEIHHRGQLMLIERLLRDRAAPDQKSTGATRCVRKERTLEQQASRSESEKVKSRRGPLLGAAGWRQEG